MDTVQLNDLEYQIDTILKSLERLKAENTSLRHRLNISVREKSQLQERNQRAANKVKQIMRQLKEEMV